MSDLATRAPGRSIELRTVADLERVADLFAASGLFKDTKDAAQCAVRIMAGAELGFQPFESMSGIHLIQGKPALGAGLMAAAVKRSGRYDYRVTTMTDDLVEVAFYQDGENIGVSSFSAQDAKKAGTQNLSKFPRNMLFARAMSNGVKWFCPDVFTTPVYTPDELGATVNDDGDVIDIPSREAPRRERASTPSEPTEPGITPQQMTALAIALKEAEFTADDEGKRKGRAFLAWLAGRDTLESAKDLTRAEASAILEKLGGGEDGTFRANRDLLADHVQAWVDDVAWSGEVSFDALESASKAAA